MKIAILGTGKIACDLLIKVIKSNHLECVLFSGRREESPGIAFAKKNQVPTSMLGIQTILAHKNQIDLVFDATSARAHLTHAPLLKANGLRVINLTPAPAGVFCVPSIDKSQLNIHDNISLITCGGQASLPIIHAITSTLNAIQYVEVVTTISAKSAGSATRQNISEYQEITESAIRHYSHCTHVKSILVINPAEPPIIMQSTIYILAESFDLTRIEASISKAISEIKTYVPGFNIIGKPVWDNGRLVVLIKVTGSGDYLPTYAGNLDIITSSAVKIALESAYSYTK